MSESIGGREETALFSKVLGENFAVVAHYLSKRTPDGWRVFDPRHSLDDAAELADKVFPHGFEIQRDGAGWSFGAWTEPDCGDYTGDFLSGTLCNAICNAVRSYLEERDAT